MTIEHLRKAYTQEPFVPFEVDLADGRVIPVPDRDFMHIPPTASGTSGIADQDGAIETFDLLLVVSLKPMNGETKRRRRG